MINAEGLTKFYGAQCAVDHINLEIQKGEIVGFLGPNGAGKTTTLRMLTGYLKPSEGNIRIKDYSINENPLEVKKLIGYLPESAPLYHEMLVYDYLKYVATICGIEKMSIDSRLKQLANLCGLNEVMHKTINTLSKGYRQRVGLAHAMINDPEILILDEPTTGLDPNQIVEVQDFLKQIGQEKTIIFSTHILSVAEATCNRIVIIDKGKIAIDEKIKTIMDTRGKETIIHISIKYTEPEKVLNELQAIRGIKEINENKEDGEIRKYTLKCETDRGILEEIYRKIKQNDWALMEFHHEKQTLEKIFRDITRGN